MLSAEPQPFLHWSMGRVAASQNALGVVSDEG